MILGFYQAINGRPTNFREKIRSCVEPVVAVGLVYTKPRPSSYVGNKNQLALIDEVACVAQPKPIEVKTTFKPKRHTIREDKSNRWRVGLKIQMVYRGKNYSIADHFNKGISGLEECKSVQRITIKWRRPSWLQKDYGDAIPPFTLKVKNQYVFIYIDNKLIGHKTLRDLALNDGFESIGEFLNYFKKSIKNWKLIHWTDIFYG